MNFRSNLDDVHHLHSQDYARHPESQTEATKPRTKRHRDDPATGCALVPLGAAAGRGDQHFKEAYEKQVRTYLELIAGLDDDTEDARAEAMLTLSALVGAVLMSRAVADKDFSDELLETVGAPDCRDARGGGPARSVVRQGPRGAETMQKA